MSEPAAEVGGSLPLPVAEVAPTPGAEGEDGVPEACTSDSLAQLLAQLQTGNDTC
jgi:hypothetical protein